MPMYLWKCVKCEQEMEVVRSIADYEIQPSEDDKAPKCRTARTKHKWERRIPSGSGTFHLVGYGWAKDSYQK